jgi:hypothetical protein
MDDLGVSKMLAMLAIIGIMNIPAFVGLLTVVIRTQKNLREIDMLHMQTVQTADRKAQIAALSAKSAALSAQAAVFIWMSALLNVLAFFYIRLL